MCGGAVDHGLAALKFVPDSALHANDDLLFYNEDFDNLDLDLHKIKLDNDNSFYEGNADTITHVRLSTWRSDFEKCKALKKR